MLCGILPKREISHFGVAVWKRSKQATWGFHVLHHVQDVDGLKPVGQLHS